MNRFYVGQKVVCIAKGNWEKSRKDHPGLIVPVRGNIYTIRENYIDPFSGNDGIRLREIVNSSITLFGETTYYIEIGWRPHEFRPVQETDISIFKRLLRPIRDKQHENS